MMESDAKWDLLDALRSALKSLRTVALVARGQSSAGTATALKKLADQLGAQLAGLGAPDQWGDIEGPSDIDSLLERAGAADASLGQARGAIDSGGDTASHFEAAVTAAEAAIEVAAILSGGNGPSRSK